MRSGQAWKPVAGGDKEGLRTLATERDARRVPSGFGSCPARCWRPIVAVKMAKLESWLGTGPLKSAGAPTLALERGPANTPAQEGQTQTWGQPHGVHVCRAAYRVGDWGEGTSELGRCCCRSGYMPTLSPATRVSPREIAGGDLSVLTGQSEAPNIARERWPRVGPHIRYITLCASGSKLLLGGPHQAGGSHMT